MDTFRPFSLVHVAVVATFALLTTVAVGLRRRWRDDAARSRRLDLTLAFAAAGAGALTIVWPLLPQHFDPAWSLPLHVCDLVSAAAALALATSRQLPRALLYYWGLGLSTHGFVTPDLQDGPARWGFWVFWLNHAAVVGAAVYDLAARHYRPTWRDFCGAVVAGVIYLAVVLPLDAALKMNYGYVGPSVAGQPNVVEFLGPWPWRVPVMCALTAGLFALMTAIWRPGAASSVRLPPAKTRR